MSIIELAIGPGGTPGVFRVEVVDSPAGQASATVELDVDSLLARRGRLQQAVLASAVPSRRVLPETEQPVRDVGQVLFAALLGTGEVAGRYQASEAVAAARGEGLRVVLRIDSPALAGLPWEAMFDRAAGAYVCRQNQLVRHVPVASVPAPLRVRLPLRILGVVSSPRGLPALDVEKEQDQLARALARPVGQGLAELHWAPGATWADLQDLLLEEEWHVLHFIGHGDFDPGRDEGMLALERDDGRTDLVAAHRLVDLLRQARPMPRLVVLNSCSGAAAGATDLFSGTAAALVRGGVAAVAAMQYEISDPAAVAFARGFYAAIARGRGVDDAISSGRVAILGLGDQTLEWVTPVLYLRGHDTFLFNIPARTADRSRHDAGTRDGDTTRSSQSGDTVGSSAAGHDSRGNALGDYIHTRVWRLVGAQADPDQPSPGALTLVSRLEHASTVQRVAFSLDGALFATVSGETVRLWEVDSGVLVHTLVGHADVVAGVAFSPDGTLLATASNEILRLWDVTAGAPARALTGHTDGVAGVAFSPDSTLIAIGTYDSTAALWDVASDASVRALSGDTGFAERMAFSPDGTLLATAGDKVVRLWNVASGALVRTLSGHASYTSGAAFSPDGTLLATADDETVRLWNVATGALLRTHADAWRGVAFTPDGSLLATTGSDKASTSDNAVRLWDVATGTLARAVTGYLGSPYGLAFSPDGILVATALVDTSVMLWA